MAAIETLPLDHITTEGTQARAALSDTIIHEYAEAMARGDAFPPIEVYFDETTYWLADGFHRVNAAKIAGIPRLSPSSARAARVKRSSMRSAPMRSMDTGVPMRIGVTLLACCWLTQNGENGTTAK